MEDFQLFIMDSSPGIQCQQPNLNNNYEFSSANFLEETEDMEAELVKREKELFLCSELGLYLVQEMDDLIEQQKNLVNDHTRVLLDLQSYEKSKNSFLDLGDASNDFSDTLSSMSLMSPDSDSSEFQFMKRKFSHAKKNSSEHWDKLEHLQTQIDELHDVDGRLKRCGSLDSLTDVRSIPESTLTTFSSVTKNFQTDLDRLQRAHDCITKLELQLDSARAKHRKLLNEYSHKLKEVGQSLGSCVEKARPYFSAVRKSRKLQVETQQAAMQYKRAVNLQKAGRDMVRVAEERLASSADKFDITWQEMLNQATLKVNEASREKDRIHSIHLRAAKNFKLAEEEKNENQATLQRSIVKAKPYFELQQDFETKLESATKRLNTLEVKLLEARQSYSAALASIRQSGDGEGASVALDSLAERGMGVGAENPFGDGSVLPKPMQDILRMEASTKGKKNEVSAEDSNAESVVEKSRYQYNPYDLMYLKDTDDEAGSAGCSCADDYIQDF